MLKWIKLLLLFTLLAVAVFVGMKVATENSASLSLMFFGVQLAELSVGLWMVIVLFVGAIMGLLISLLPLFFSRYSSINKDKKILKLEAELNKLRVSGVKG